MKITGSNTITAPVAQVWTSLLDPAVLVRTIPGCERLEATDTNAYAMTVTAGVAAIKGTYTGTCSLSDLVERESLTMKLSGSGAPGTVDASVGVRFTDLGAEGTRIDYDADAVVGGMVGGVGQRMLTSVSKRMAGEFFGNVGKAISGAPVGAASAATAATPAAPGAVFTAPAAASSGTVSRDFLTGIAVGAGLVALGVLLGRRRR